MRTEEINMRLASIGLALGLALACAGVVNAQGWPTKPIRVIGPYSPGPVPEGLFRVMQALADPGVKRRIGETGHITVGLGPRDSAAFIRS